MFIPLDHPNWVEYYWAAKEQGIKLTSRYVGVYIRIQHTNIGDSLSFIARAHLGKHPRHLGAYPFTKEGEERAAERHICYTIRRKTRAYKITSGRVRYEVK